MKIDFTLNQACAFSSSEQLYYSFAFSVREALSLEKGESLDWADCKDILNGYGFTLRGELLSSDVFITRDNGEFGEPTVSVYSANYTTTFDVNRLHSALAIQEQLFWALSFAHGTETLSRDVKRAYKLRKEFYRLLDAWEF